MPFLVHCLGYERPWRKGASVREADAVDSLVDALEDVVPLDLVSERAHAAAEFSDAVVAGALRDEAGGSMLLEVGGGRVELASFELRDPRTDELIDDSWDGVLAEIEVAASANLLVKWLAGQYGPCAEATGGTRVIVPVEQPDRQSTLSALGVVAQLSDRPCSALIEVEGGVQMRAELDPERGARVLPLVLGGDPVKVARFWELAGVELPGASAWCRPEVPDEVRVSPAAQALVQVADDPLCSGPADDRIEALNALLEARSDGWVSQLLAAAESPDNREPAFREVLAALYRQLCRIMDPRVTQLLWQRLRSEDDQLARVISHGLWQQPGLVERIPAAVLAHWDDDPSYAYRLLVAAVDANLSWPTELIDETPAEVRDRLRREGMWPAGAA